MCVCVCVLGISNNFFFIVRTQPIHMWLFNSKILTVKSSLIGVLMAEPHDDR